MFSPRCIFYFIVRLTLCVHRKSCNYNCSFTLFKTVNQIKLHGSSGANFLFSKKKKINYRANKTCRVTCETTKWHVSPIEMG